MHATIHVSISRNCQWVAVFALLALTLRSSPAATLWTGTIVSFTESGGSPADTVLAGKVVLTRAGRDVLYNTALGETGPGLDSPAGTTWAFSDRAFGDLSDAETLTYQSLESMRNGDLADLIKFQPMVMHILDGDIYVAVEFQAWGQHGAGGFSYLRSTAPTAVPPSVSITNPAGGAVFAAPANVKIAASATVSPGTVTNVAFFRGSTSIGSVQTPPFSLTVSNLAAGPYALTAVATASGISTTSSVVNITVVTPVAVNITSPHAGSGLFSFNYSANSGLRYVVERSVNLTTWTPVVTNIAAGNPVPFSESLVTSPPRYYRVGRLPNP